MEIRGRNHKVSKALSKAKSNQIIMLVGNVERSDIARKIALCSRINKRK